MMQKDVGKMLTTIKDTKHKKKKSIRRNSSFSQNSEDIFQSTDLIPKIND